MLSKFSVRKPYTVVVGIVLVLLLGFVSFGNMTADLLPNISLPYAIVMTTYPGASPSAVEEMVSRPVEQAMATVSNIENIQSVSSENVSMVLLEFSQSANMDSVSLEMREKLDQISGEWEENIGKPAILKLNPNMLPIMVTALEKNGEDSVEITNFVKNEVISDLESIEGVASVEMTGGVEERVDVILRQDKIDQVNEKIFHEMEGQFADAKKELTNAETELNDSQRKIEEGKSGLADGREQLAEQLGNARSQISEKQNLILKSEMDLDLQLSQIAEKESELEKNENELNRQELQLKEAQEQLDQLPKKKEELELQKKQLTELQTQLVQVQNTLPVLRENIRKMEQQLEQLEDDAPEEEKEQLLIQLARARKQLTDLEAILVQTGITEEQIPKKLEETAQQIAAADQGIAQVEEAMSDSSKQQQIIEGRKEIEAARSQIHAGQQQLSQAKQELNQAKQQITSGKATLSQALAELNKKEIAATIEMAGAQAELLAGESQLENGKKQLEEGEKTLEQQEKAAYDQADLSDKITMDTVKQILLAQNFSMPAGYVTEEGIEYLIRVGDKFTDLEEIKNLILIDMDMEEIEPIRLSDVADVVQTDNSGEVYAVINGNPGIMLSINKQTNYSTGEVTDRLNDYFQKLMETDPDVSVTNLMDQGIYIDMVVNSVLQNLAVGAVLAVLVLILFLRDVRPTLVVACSIPISVMTAVVLMYFSGVTLNVISLSGLALGVGMLVDNSIVVIENIFRLRSLGYSGKQAAIEGASQMSGAIIASTLTTVCVFTPIVFSEGITRQLFVDMGLTIGYSLLASLAVALTLVPTMAAGLMSRQKVKESGEKTQKLLDGYGKLLETALQKKAFVLIGAFFILTVSIMAAFSRGSSFMPAMESTQVSVSVELPEKASIEDTGKMADEVMKRLSEIEDVEEIGAMAGASGMMGDSPDNKASLYLILREDKKLSGDELTDRIVEKTKDLDCEVKVQTSSMDMSALGSSGIAVQIKGKDLDVLQRLAKETAEAVRGVEGTQDISDGMEKTTEELRIQVKKDKAAEYHLTVAQVYQQVSEKLAESGSATILSTESRDYPVMVVDEKRSQYTREDIKSMNITVTDKEGSVQDVPIGDLVEFVPAEGLQSINREDQSRYLTVTAAVDQEHNIGLVAKEVEKALKTVELPEGYTMEMTGEDKTIQESMTEVLKMLGLAVVFMYLIMVAQFQSLLSPFIVMFTIPLAFTGGFLGLFLSGKEVSVIAMIGFVMLSGIIVNNGIVLVDCVNRLRMEGMEKREAIVQAGKTRMRPILMTALTTILGLAAMAMGLGMGGDMVQPMAIVTIGGLTYGTLLTLFVVPCIYDILNHRRYKKEE